MSSKIARATFGKVRIQLPKKLYLRKGEICRTTEACDTFAVDVVNV